MVSSMEQPERFVDKAQAAQKRCDDARSARDTSYHPSREDAALMKKMGETFYMWNELKKDRGRRYAECTFDNYDITDAKQRKVVDALRGYAADRSNIENGVGVMLFGTKGSGKDHLLMALAREVVRNHGVCAYWMNGVSLHAELKRFDFDNKNINVCLGSIDTRPERTPIFWVSDPLPPSGALSEYQQRLLFEVIDMRYSDMLPTWMTMNVENGSEAETRMGAQNVDRLCHGALVLACDWPSYRSATKKGKQ